jgi:GT2 family glycosyltransferase
MKKTLVCCAMNRNAMLQDSLQTWLNQNAPFDEFVIVDWGGSERVQDVLPNRDSRFVVVRVLGEPYFILTLAYNLGIRVATGDAIYKMDTDYVLEPSFTQQYRLVHATPSFFWAGNWRIYEHTRETDWSNKCNISGCVVVRRHDFWSVGGYNENIVTYGYDDDDLYERLCRGGYVRRNLQYGPIQHTQHGDERRAMYGIQRDELIEKNRMISKIQRWNSSSKRAYWKVNYENPNFCVCERQV